MNVVAIAAAAFAVHVGTSEQASECMFVDLSICIATTQIKTVYVARRCVIIICYWHVYVSVFVANSRYFNVRPVKQHYRNTCARNIICRSFYIYILYEIANSSDIEQTAQQIEIYSNVSAAATAPPSDGFNQITTTANETQLQNWTSFNESSSLSPNRYCERWKPLANVYLCPLVLVVVINFKAATNHELFLPILSIAKWKVIENVVANLTKFHQLSAHTHIIIV